VEVVRNNRKTLIEPEEISAMILKELKESAENYFPKKNTCVHIENAVITVPAYFNDSQRKATIKSAHLAGFKAVRLLNEPTAAAMAYGLFVAGEKKVIVFDFGGGTLDVSLMEINEGKFEVIGIGGDTNLGGEDLTHAIMNHIIELLYQHYDDFNHKKLPPKQLALIRQRAEEAKIQLSTQETAQIQFTRQDFFEDEKDTEPDADADADAGAKNNFTFVLTRINFQELAEDIFQR
jgi:molecular chaperone DnaK (HSP70)